MKFDDTPPKSIAQKLWHIVKVLYCMLHKTISKQKLMIGLNFHLLLKHSKTARKSIGSLLHSSHHRNSCRHADPSKFYVPQEIEFSCSNTPLHATKRKGDKHQYRRFFDDQVSAIAKAFEMLNSEAPTEDSSSDVLICSPTPMGRLLRVTDSPFPISEEEGEYGGQVDREAEEFIDRFYDQLRLQQQRVRFVNWELLRGWICICVHVNFGVFFLFSLALSFQDALLDMHGPTLCESWVVVYVNFMCEYL